MASEGWRRFGEADLVEALMIKDPSARRRRITEIYYRVAARSPKTKQAITPEEARRRLAALRGKS